MEKKVCKKVLQTFFVEIFFWGEKVKNSLIEWFYYKRYITLIFYFNANLLT